MTFTVNCSLQQNLHNRGKIIHWKIIKFNNLSERCKCQQPFLLRRYLKKTVPKKQHFKLNRIVLTVSSLPKILSIIFNGKVFFGAIIVTKDYVKNTVYNGFITCVWNFDVLENLSIYLCYYNVFALSIRVVHKWCHVHRWRV
jgi:hypothetical protein